MTDNPVPAPKPASATKPRRWLGIALVASVAVNLFFAGLMLGGPLFRGGPDHAAERLMPSPRAFIEVLGHDRGRAVLRDMRREVPDLRARFAAMREARLAVAGAIGAKPYDAQAVTASFDRLRRAHIDLTTAIQRPLVGAFAGMTAEERARFADIFADQRHRHRGRTGPEAGSAGAEGEGGPR